MVSPGAVRRNPSRLAASATAQSPRWDRGTYSTMSRALDRGFPVTLSVVPAASR